MNPGFMISRRKTYELVALIVFNIITYLLWESIRFNSLFSFGFIWNWVVSQEDMITVSNPRRYRFSTLRFVFLFQNFFMRIAKKAPQFLFYVIKVLPAGLFWLFIIFVNDANMPWWAVFLGSIAAELIQLDSFVRKEAP